MTGGEVAYELARCIVCGLADTTDVASGEEIRDEVEALWAFHLRRLQPDTPPEQLTDRVAFSQRPALRIVECRGCGLLYRNPRERAHELEDIYGRAEVEPAVLDALYETQLPSYAAQARRLTRVVGRAGRGLEVGSYSGAFLGAAAREGWTFEALDIGEVAIAAVRRRGYRAHYGDLASRAEHPERYDAIAIWNTFEQLADPRADAAIAARLLAPGGTLVVRVPNGRFYASVRRRLRGPLAPVARMLLAHNNLLAFPYRHGFGTRSLGRLFRSLELDVVHVHGDALVPIADRFTRRWAALEERALKAALRTLGRAEPSMAPWIEVYARRREPHDSGGSAV